VCYVQWVVACTRLGAAAGVGHSGRDAACQPLHPSPRGVRSLQRHDCKGQATRANDGIGRGS
jgi:hypothetical protein